MQDIGCSILPIFPAHSVSSLGTLSCFPFILLLFGQETKNTHHTLVTSDGLRPGWEGHCFRHGLEDSIVFCIFFFFWLACILPFRYCNLNFVLFFESEYSLYPNHVVQRLKKKSAPLSGWVPAWAGPSPSFWAAAAPGDLWAGQELILGALHAGAPLHQPQVPLGSLSLITFSLSLWYLPCTLPCTWMITLVDFSPNVTESRLIVFLFFFPPFPHPGCLQY